MCITFELEKGSIGNCIKASLKYIETTEDCIKATARHIEALIE